MTRKYVSSLSLMALLLIISDAELFAQGIGLEVGLKNSEVFYPQSLKFKSPPFGKSYLLVDDSIRYQTEELSYYQDATGYYRWMIIDGKGNSQRMKRETKGRVSTYSMMVMSTSAAGPNGMPTSYSQKVEYFQKGDSPVQLINYDNLKTALSDDPNSMAELEKAKKLKTARIVGICAGGALMAAGLIQTINSIEDPDMSPSAGGNVSDESSVKYSPLLFAGGGVIGISFILGLTSKDKQRAAIDIYNR